VSTAPYAFIARGYCPGCRHELTGLPYARHIPCPECGVGTEIGDLPLIPAPGRHRRVAAIVALALALIVMLGLLLPAIVPPPCSICMSQMTTTRLQSLHGSLQTYARNGTGQYPVHAAMLVHLNYFPPSEFVDYRSAGIDGRVFGDVDLLNYDWSPEATAAIDAEIASCDVSAPYYRIGDTWLVRLPHPTYSPLLVAGWCDVVSDGERWVVFDDNQVKAVDRRGWNRIWRTDAGERARLGLLPRVPAPPWSGCGG
jgi:hypothetical protein